MSELIDLLQSVILLYLIIDNIKKSMDTKILIKLSQDNMHLAKKLREAIFDLSVLVSKKHEKSNPH